MQTKENLNEQYQNILSILKIQEKINSILASEEKTDITYSCAMVDYLITNLKTIIMFLQKESLVLNYGLLEVETTS